MNATDTDCQHWDDVRKRMSHTHSRHTALKELAKEWGLKWPSRKKGDCPENYLRLNWEELNALPAFKRNKSLNQVLLTLFDKTLEFDEAINGLDGFYSSPSPETTTPDSLANSTSTPLFEETKFNENEDTPERLESEHPPLPTALKTAANSTETIENSAEKAEEEDPFDWDWDEAAQETVDNEIDPLAILRRDDEEESPIEMVNEQATLDKNPQPEKEKAPEESQKPLSKPKPPTPNYRTAASANPIEILQEWQVPLDYPVQLMGLAEKEHQLCTSYQITTLRELTENFTEKCEAHEPEDAKLKDASHNIQEFLRNLQIKHDEEVAKILPLRPYHTGIHLLEAFKMALRSFPLKYKSVLLNRLGNETMLEYCAGEGSETRDDVKEIEAAFFTKLRLLFKWFPKEHDALWQLWKEGHALEDYFSDFEESLFQKAASNSVATLFELSPEGTEIVRVRKELFEAWCHEISEFSIERLVEFNLVQYLATKDKAHFIGEFALFGKKNDYFEYHFANQEFVIGPKLSQQDTEEPFKTLFCHYKKCSASAYEKQMLSSARKNDAATLPLFLSLKRKLFVNELALIAQVADAHSYAQFHNAVSNAFSGKQENQSMSLSKEALLNLGQKIFSSSEGTANQ